LTEHSLNHNKQAIIFDLDGLIIETEAIYCHIWQREFAKEGLPFDMAGYQNLWRPPRDWRIQTSASAG